MAIQFVGSKSLDDRRRRRLAVNGDGAPAESVLPEEGASRVESELVMSAAAVPWVPAYEWRIWTYGAMLGLLLIAVSFALAQPSAFRPELAPLTKHLLQGSRPVLATVIQTMFWFLCAQLAILISWYRTQCKLDFDGRYRVWPWAAAFFGLAAICSATNLHVLFGQIISQGEWLVWRSETVAWLLPTCVAALPLTVLLDRDVRRGRTTIYTLRTAWFLGLAATSLELFAADLQEQAWYPAVRSIVPLFFGATLFLGLWLHARVVAFVCPDPPECDEPGAASQLLGAGRWCVQLVGRLMSFLFRRSSGSAATDDEADAKPKRRSRKATDPEEDAAPKRKRKATTKRATKPRTRVKAVEEEQEAEDETDDESYSDEADESSDAYDAESSSSTESEWDEDEAEVETPPSSVRQNRPTSSYSSMPTVPPKKTEAPSWQNRSAQPSRSSQPQAANEDESDSNEDESEDGDSSYRVDDGLTADQLRGLSKRQKRELRQKVKDQQRNVKR